MMRMKHTSPCLHIQAMIIHLIAPAISPSIQMPITTLTTTSHISRIRPKTHLILAGTATHTFTMNQIRDQYCRRAAVAMDRILIVSRRQWKKCL